MSNEPRVRIPAKPAFPPSNAPVRGTAQATVRRITGVPSGRPPAGGAPQRSTTARSSASMAVGTLISRILGLVKGVVLGIAIADTTVADVFEGSNYLPNIIFLLVAGGVFNAVLIPQIAKASRQPDRGSEFISRLLTLGVTGLLALTVIVTALVAPIMEAFTSFSGGQLRLAITFGLFLLPQIFFYGLYSLLGQILNAHNAFRVYAWAPVVNNVVAIAGLLAFILVAGSSRTHQHTVDNWTTTETLLLAGTATLGIVVQSAVLLIPVKRLGLELRPRFGLRGTGLGLTAKIAGWTMGTMVIGQLSYLVVLRVATISAGSKPDGAASGAGGIPGIYEFNRATELYIMPHSIIALSIATVMFTAMARAAAAHDFSGLRSSLSAALRTTGVATVFASIALIVLSGPLGMLFGGNSQISGRQIAITLAILAIGAPFFSVYFILNRVLYALEDARTPFIIQCIVVATSVAMVLGAAALPPRLIIYGLAVSYTLNNFIGPFLSHHYLKRRLGNYGGGRILQAYMRFLAAALVAGVAGELALRVFGSSSPDGFMWTSITASFVTLAVVGPVMAVVYFLMLKVLRVHEIDDVVGPILAKVRSRISPQG
ncbi:murein biosynthesis integral membrane protein MurJ [Arthrobacter sp. SDTb3-6]|uniref:murein biosynthesis integral membrane protein MurJ n=1 Tax=Arthrobacter sp. SDTb3-6 TaxID=2713571 RepID=UPI00159DFF7F|nr:murein biosynthesis integral membrane protein MurJ [Arthrobacter sp. SDTb3-6]NVM99149.1 murein biosynthesis integral membrane protein MurJ [Arthrobacter sp. SDTb3-6]